MIEPNVVVMMIYVPKIIYKSVIEAVAKSLGSPDVKRQGTTMTFDDYIA